jgi:hypothetical protein
MLLLVLLFPYFFERYTAWLPNKTVNLYREQSKWHEERLAKLGNSEAHVKFWKLLDQIALGFWDATRKGIKVDLFLFLFLLF